MDNQVEEIQVDVMMVGAKFNKWQGAQFLE